MILVIYQLLIFVFLSFHRNRPWKMPDDLETLIRVHSKSFSQYRGDRGNQYRIDSGKPYQEFFIQFGTCTH